MNREITPEEVFEFCESNGIRIFRKGGEHFADLKSLEDYIKPKLTPVDLSVLIESGIDCEFSNDLSDWCIIGKLRYVESDAVYPYEKLNGGIYKHCRPRENHWHSLRNCPGVVGRPIVMLEKAGFLIGRSTDGGHIKINGIRDDRCWPWEADNE